MKSVFITLLMFFLLIGLVKAQFEGEQLRSNTSKTYLIELEDGIKLIGKIIKQDSISISMVTLSGVKMEIPIDKITSRGFVKPENIVDGKYWFPNPNETRYLFGPSAFNLKKGEGYFQNTYLFLNSINVGATNNFTLGGGFELMSTFAGGDPLFYVTPKFGFKLAEKVNAGAGVLYVRIPGDGGDVGITYGIATYGTADHNITGGLGWGFVEREMADRPIVTFSGMTRVAKKTALVTENWFVPIDDRYFGLITYGVRFFGEKLSVDLAFINNAKIVKATVIGVPYVDFVVKF